MANDHPLRKLVRAIAVLGTVGLIALTLDTPTAVAEQGDQADTSDPADTSDAAASAAGSSSAARAPEATVESASSGREVAQASVASLQVDRAAVRSQLAEAKAARDHQFDRWALRHLGAQAAQEQLRKSSLEAVYAQQQVVVAEERVREYAVEAFMNPPALESMSVLAVGDAEQASRAHDLISITADDQGRVVDELAGAEKTAVRKASAAEEAAAVAAEKESATKAELEALEESVRTQRRLNSQIDQRLNSAMAEVAALREVDSRAADEMEAEELALASDSKAALGEDAGDGTSDSDSEVAPAPRTSTNRNPRPAASPTPTTARPRPRPQPVAPKPSGPPPSPPAGTVTWSEVTKVGTFWVHRSIASNVQNLVSAASAAGFNLTGGGFRDPASQISLRQAHCGPTYYDIYQKPASQCSPPTAIPGRSMHEQGRALDIKSGGSLIRSRSNPAFQWLAANASRYGFYNLPSEPWHWSTNGS